MGSVNQVGDVIIATVKSYVSAAMAGITSRVQAIEEKLAVLANSTNARNARLDAMPAPDEFDKLETRVGSMNEALAFYGKSVEELQGKPDAREIASEISAAHVSAVEKDFAELVENFTKGLADATSD